MLGLVLLLAAIVAGGAGKLRPPRRPSQGQAAGQFLRAVLRADYTTAYGRLAPEVRRGVSLPRFTTAAYPLWKSGQRRGPQIELYKLGVRLGNGGSARLFYAFSFVRDSATNPPPIVLEVVFRDTAARAVLGFALRPVQRTVPIKTRP